MSLLLLSSVADKYLFEKMDRGVFVRYVQKSLHPLTGTRWDDVRIDEKNICPMWIM